MTNKYDYMEEMKKDIREYIDNEIDLSGYEDKDDLYEFLNDELWIADSVTGNGSGSYTFCRETAKQYVLDNMDLLKECVYGFDIRNDIVAEKFLNEEYEYFDVSIRCYLLSSAILEVLEDIEL